MALVLGTNCGFVLSAPSADPEGSNQGVIDGRATYIIATSPAGATKITEVGFWCDTASEESNFEVGLYDNDGEVVPGEAGTLLYSSTTNAKGTDAGWKTATVDWSISGSTTYCIAFQLDNVLTATYGDYESSGFSGYDGKTAATLDDPFDGGALVDSDGIYAVYAVYETGSASSSISSSLSNSISSSISSSISGSVSSSTSSSTSNSISSSISLSASSSISGSVSSSVSSSISGSVSSSVSSSISSSVSNLK